MLLLLPSWMLTIVVAFLTPLGGSAWTTTTSLSSSTATTPTTQLHAMAVLSRREWFTSVVLPTTAATSLAFLSASTSSPLPAYAAATAGDVKTLPNGVTYVVNQAGSGPEPERGELVAIRFRAFCGDNKIDDIFDTPEPYYTRIGSGGLIKGVEEALPYMKLGDRWTLTIPGSLAFGSKGRPSSAGKPRIPSDATIIFDVSMEGLPGREPELIELIGDE